MMVPQVVIGNFQLLLLIVLYTILVSFTIKTTNAYLVFQQQQQQQPSSRPGFVRRYPQHYYYDYYTYSNSNDHQQQQRRQYRIQPSFLTTGVRGQYYKRISSSSSFQLFQSTTTTNTILHDDVVHIPNDDNNNNNNIHITTKSTTTKIQPNSSSNKFYKHEEYTVDNGAITLPISELTMVLGSSNNTTKTTTGRAKMVWDCYRLGIDPDLFYNNTEYYNYHQSTALPLLPSQRRTQQLGRDALFYLSNTYNNTVGSSTTTNNQNENPKKRYRIENDIVTVVSITQSRTVGDDTTKLVVQLRDGSQVETVIIPFNNTTTTNNARSTICISSQVGCQQRCQFCATGTMGKIRSLTTSEIVGQFFLAQQIVRLSNVNKLPLGITTTTGGSTTVRKLPSISNVVFMGMGEPADNAMHVNRAVHILTNPEGYQLSATRVTVSTVAPTPAAFTSFTTANCLLAWSVHAVNNTLRKQLVPTTKYTMEELRNGLITTLLARKPVFRTTMLEIVLMDHVNDSIQDAEQLVEFCQGLINAVPYCKLIVNLIPYNEISTTTLPSALPVAVQPNNNNFRKPSKERIRTFQSILRENKIYTQVRTPRGDDDSAACGQLVTTKKKGRVPLSSIILNDQEE